MPSRAPEEKAQRMWESAMSTTTVGRLLADDECGLRKHGGGQRCITEKAIQLCERTL